MGDTKLEFGKHRGRTFADLKASEPGYVSWALKQESPTGGLAAFAAYLRSEGCPDGPQPGAAPTFQPGAHPGSQTLHFVGAAPAFSASSSQGQGAVLSPPGPGQKPGQISPPGMSQTSGSQGRPPSPQALNFEGAATTTEQKPIPVSLSLELVSTQEFQIAAVDAAFVPKPIWSALSSLPDVAMSPCRKKWRFPLESYKAVVEQLRKSPSLKQCTLELVPEWVTKAIAEFAKTAEEERTKASERLEVFLQKLPRDLLDEKPLMPFQIEGIAFGLARKGRCILGDEMGLGKTLQALAIAANYTKEWPVLVIAPSSLRLVWRDQALQWLPHLLPAGSVQVLANSKQKVDADAKLIVISYDLLARNNKYAQRADGQHYEVVLVDESHYIKDSSTKRSKAVLALCRLAERCVLISGTPALNRASELHTQLQAALPDYTPSFFRYVERYSNKEVVSFGGRQVVRWAGAKRSAELNALLTGTIMVRRLKKDVLTQLPSKRRQRIALATDKLDTQKIKEVKDCIKEQKQLAKEAELSGEGATMPPVVMQTFKLTAESKMEAVAEYVEYLLSNDLKFLIFAHHHVMLDRLEQKMEELRVDYIRIDGKTSHQKRQDAVESFQTNERVRVAVLGITAAGTGLTLTAAHTVVFAELYWVPGQMMQAEDRAHRIGQVHSVDVHYCIAEGTLDDVMFGSLNKKTRDMTSILNGAESGIQAKQHDTNVQDMEAWRERTGGSAASGSKRPRVDEIPATGLAKFFKLAKPKEPQKEDAAPLDLDAEAQRGA